MSSERHRVALDKAHLSTGLPWASAWWCWEGKKWLWAGRDCGADLDCRWAATCQADLHPLRPWLRDADTHKTVLKCAAQAGCPLTWCLCVHVCDCSCLMLKVCQWQDEHIYLVQLSALCVHATKEKRAFKEEKARQPGTQPAVRHTRTHTHIWWYRWLCARAAQPLSVVTLLKMLVSFPASLFTYAHSEKKHTVGDGCWQQVAVKSGRFSSVMSMSAI